MPIVCLAKVSPLDPATGNRVDLYLSSADDSRVTGLNGLVWEPALTAAPSLSINLWQGDFQEPVDTGGASFGFNIGILKMTYANADTYMWAGAPVEIYAEEPGTAWPWAQRFKGRVAGFSRRNQVVTINSKIDTEPFEKNVLTATYAGTTGAEGSADLKGRLKPLVIGWAKNVEPVLIDATNSVYQFSAYGAIEAVSVLYERATDFGASVGDYATYAALVAATIPAGRWGTCLAAGMVRLGAPAAGVITGDIRGHRVGGTTPRLTGAVISALATIAGVSAGNIESATLTALDAAVPYPINIVLTEQAKFNDIAASLALACNWQSGITLQGKFFTLAVTLTGSEVLTLNAQGSALPQVTSSDEQDVSVPYYQTIFGAGRNWRVQSADEIAFTAQLIERGTYNGAETYREGNIVTTDDGARWLYINTTAGSGNAPPTLPTTSNAYWSNMTEASPVAVLGFLTNESHNVFADSAGTVASWTGAGGTFVVQENGVTLSSGITFSLVSATGVTVSINATSGVYAATAMSANTGTATLRAVYNGVTIDKIFSISKTIQGTTGAAGSNTSSVLLYQRTTTGSAPAVVTTGSATYTFASGAITGQPSGWTPSIPSSGGGFLWVIRAVASASAATDTIANTEWSAPVLQSQDGAPGSPGAAATSAYLTNESVQLFAYANGNVVSYTGATGDFKVFAGSTDISASFTLSTQANPQALTIGYSGLTYTVTAGFDAGEDTATVTIRATGSGAYAGVAFDKVLSLSKVKGGYEIVAALPSTNLFSGRVVFNEADDKLYRYTGTAWTAAVPAADVSGQINYQQIGDGAVRVNHLLVQANNLNPDPQFTDQTLWYNDNELDNGGDGILGANTQGWYVDQVANAQTAGVPAAVGTRWVILWSARAGQNNDARFALYARTDQNNRFAVTPGQVLELKAGAQNDSNQTFTVAVQFFDLAFTYLDGGGLTWAATQSGGKSTQLTVPNNARWGRIVVFNQGGPTFGGATLSGYCRVGNISVRDTAGASLIVDGAIVAGKVASNAITTDKLDAGAVTAAKIAASNVITLSAQINDAVITNAKIGDLQVNTLKIANNAVTIGVSAYGASDVDVPETNEVWYDVQSLTISTSGGPVILLGQVDFWGFAGWCYPTLRIVRGSTVLKNALPTGASEATGADSVIMFVDTPAASTYTYKLQVTNAEGAALCRARSRFLFALETKK